MRLYFGFMLCSVFLVSCSSVPQGVALKENNVVGIWENKKSSIFGSSGWDICEFKMKDRFICTNYPKIGDLALPYEGYWKLEGKSIVLTKFDSSGGIKVKITGLSKNRLSLEKSSGEEFFYVRQ